MLRACVVVVAAIAAGGIDARAQTPMGTAWTYQGELRSSGQPTAGPADLRFRLYNAAAGGNQIGAQVDRPSVTLAQGRFVAEVDFGGAAFGPDARWLEIDVRSPAGSGPYVTLAPRQRVTGAPAALFAQNAASAGTAVSAGNATQLNGQGAAFYQNAGNLTGTLPAASLGGTYSGVLNLSNAGNTFSGSGAGLTNLNASNIAAGTVSNDRLPVPLSLLGSATSVIGATNSMQGGVGIAGHSTATSGNGAGGQFVSWGTSGAGITGDSIAGIGATFGGRFTSSSTSGRGVFGEAGATSGPTVGGEFHNASSSGIGVLGRASASTGSTFGLQGLSSSTSGNGVFGHALATSGSSYGVRGQSDSTGGSGVWGYASASSGDTRGGRFQSDSTTGIAVYGLAAAHTGANIGVQGQTESAQGVGVLGLSSSVSGLTYGGFFQTNSVDGTAVYGRATSASGNSYAGRFENNSQQSSAVLGWATYGSGFTYGVRGEVSSPSGWAVWAQGRSGASGTKSFRIDHPADPENKYLLHYSAESPEVINFYSGKIALDAGGGAVVELPAYFARLNKDPRYSLTPLGASMPMLHIAEEVSDEALRAGAQAGPGDAVDLCTFRIAGGVPGGKVSWRIEAVRNDLWMQHRGAPVEMEKEGHERGTYQHPEFYGQPPEKGAGYESRRPRQEGAGGHGE